LNRRVGSVILVILTAAAGCWLLARLLMEEDLSRWHAYLRQSDLRLLVAWIAATPLLWGLTTLRQSRAPALAAIFFAAVAQATLAAAVPAESEKLLSAILEPLAGFVGAFCAVSWTIGRIWPGFGRTEAALFLFGTGLGLTTAVATGWEGWIVSGLPPDYHDEYAYLFQAWTYLDGRFAYPTDALSPAFDQVHVLNDGVFASRYFPGTAVWLAPFVAAGRPIAAMWFAHALTCGFFALVAARIDRRAGWIAALLIATAPGMISFSNALLSTAPTTAALGAFMWAWFRAHERREAGFSVIAALAVGFAFLTRPLTAATIGFPFAAYSLFRAWKPRFDGERRNVALMTATFVLCAALLPMWSLATIGTAHETPYDRYTRVRTPSHVYGFYNAERGRARWTDGVFYPYDAWASNLTPVLAAQTLAARVQDALREGTGGYLVVISLLVAAAIIPRCDDRGLLLWLAIVALASAYTPYWFVGLFGFGYLAEALPVLLTLAALAAVWMYERSSTQRQSPWALVLPSLLLLQVLANIGDIDPQMFKSDAAGLFARREKKQIVDLEDAALRNEKCKILVLIMADAKTAVHSTLVNNHPRLDAPVVRAWAKPELMEGLLNRYSDRAVFLLDYKGFAQPFDWHRVSGPKSRR